MVTIKVRQNGSLLVDGPREEVRLIDWNGNEYQIEKWPFALCRCGFSTKKPFCDGTHSRIGFQAAQAAIGPEATDKPAQSATQPVLTEPALPKPPGVAGEGGQQKS